MEIFDLTPDQKKAFNRLKKAYADCEKLGVYFINNYGALGAVDNKIICGYADSKTHAKGVSEISVYDAGEVPATLKIAQEWTDDEHYYGLTELGHDIYFNRG